MLASVFTADATLDRSPTGAKVGVKWPTVPGRDAIVAMCTGFIGLLDTSQGRHLLLMNRLDAEAVRDTGQWHLRRPTIDNT